MRMGLTTHLYVLLTFTSFTNRIAKTLDILILLDSYLAGKYF